MAKKKREVPEINSSSTADIAFLLLIFFLITTSMDTDRGLARRLPPPPEKDQKLDDAKKKERNVLQVFLNMQDQLMCGNDYITVDIWMRRGEILSADRWSGTGIRNILPWRRSGA